MRRGPAALRPAAESFQGYLADIRVRTLRAPRNEPLSVVRGRGGLQEAEFRQDRPHHTVDFRGVSDFQASQCRLGVLTTVLKVSTRDLRYFFSNRPESGSACPGGANGFVLLQKDSERWYSDNKHRIRAHQEEVVPIGLCL